MIPEHELRQMYHNDQMSTYDIAKKIGVYPSTVFNWIKKCGIKTRTNSESLLVNTSKPSKKELEEMYSIKNMSSAEIAKYIGVSQPTICIWMKKYGIKARTDSEIQLGNSVKPPKEYFEEMYHGRKMSITEIADKIAVSTATIFNWMQSYGIELRTISESVSGESNSNWQGGISFEPYCKRFNNEFKEAVRKRDDYTCQLCGYEQKLGGRKLDVHHIHYDKKNCYPDVVALCPSCHGKVNSNRDFWEECFESILIKKGLICWSITQET